MEQVFVVFQTTFSLIGCILNGLLCYVAYFKSPSLIRTYSIITVNFAITDFAICILNFLLQTRLIATGNAFIFVPLGPCKWMGSKVCYYIHMVFVHGYTHTIWLLLVSFCYRYYVMIKSEPSKLAVNLLLLIVYTPSFVQMILLCLEYADPSVLLSMQQRLLPQYNLKGVIIYGIEDNTTFPTMFTIVHMSIMSAPIVMCIFVLRKRIVQKLNFKGVDVHPKTRTLQMQLLRALTFQSIIPCFYGIGMASYFVGSLDIYRDPFFEYLIHSTFLLVPVLTPISSFVFVTPYRKWILRIVHVKQGGFSSDNYDSRGEICVFSVNYKLSVK